MKITPHLIILLISSSLFCQDLSLNSSQTRAVIVGISDFQNEDIPDLRFAHKDAAAFAEYLKSPAGGSLDEDQLQILLNENATTAQIAAALEWLDEVSKEGEPERANFLYQKAIELISDSLTNELAISFTDTLLKLNRYQDAVEFFPDDLQSEDPDTNYTFATLYYKLNRLEKAEAHFQKYFQLSKNPFKAQIIGTFYYLNSEFELTEKYFKKALEINPKYHGPYIGSSLLYYNFRKYEKAVQVLEEGIENYPGKDDLKIMKAFMIGLSDASETSKAFKELEPIYPDAAKIGACLTLMRENKFEVAMTARARINEAYANTTIPLFLDISYVQMLVAQKDFNSAMGIIEKNTYSLFSYELLQRDPALAPLRETEQFKTYMQRNYSGKMNRE
ncbi:MAG: hypothetical protein P1U70_11175 [Saprospiraceae bacterium]|jgi:tetratricopeptide (TPR) repeat protein|nr:hypothetical protein [Saprospiraceae bacterium]